MKNVISMLVAALLAIVFITPVMAAEQQPTAKQAKTQSQKISNEQRRLAEQEFLKDYNKGLAKSTCYPNCPKQNPPPNLFKAYLDKK